MAQIAVGASSAIAKATLLVALGSMVACAIDPGAGFGDLEAAIEVPQTPFYPQERFQCGPAALKTVLEASGADIDLGSLVEQVYVPAMHGSLQAEIVAATRAAERIPYLLDPSLAAIAAELRQQRPVLVLQNLGVRWLPRWHYAVVYRVDPIRNTVTLRSGTDRERETPADVFVRTWRRSDFWALAVLRPGELPANPDAERYFSAVAAMEETGHDESAHKAWEAARETWPDATVPLFGLANRAFRAGDLRTAERDYRRLLILDPNHVGAQNNLAYVLAADGRRAAAIKLLQDALDRPGVAAGWVVELEDSLAEINAYPEPGTQQRK